MGGTGQVAELTATGARMSMPARLNARQMQGFRESGGSSQQSHALTSTHPNLEAICTPARIV